MQQIDANEYFTCAVVSDGKVYCWGRNSFGQLGNGSTAASSVPVAVLQGEIPAEATIIQVASGGSSYSFRMCVVSTGGSYCWGGSVGQGGSTNGYLGSSTGSSLTPIRVTDEWDNVAQLSVDGIAAPYAVVSDSELRFTTPAHAVGQVPVVVTDYEGLSVTYSGFTYVDTTPPTISLPNTYVDVTLGSNFDELAGVSATDDVDGDIALTMTHVSEDITTSSPIGTYRLIYTVTDSSGNTATASRLVNVQNLPPQIIFVNDMDWYDRTLQKGESFDPRAQIKSVVDDIDGVMDIQDVVITSMPALDTNKYGAYMITYEITDAAGNVGVRYGTVSIPGVNYNTTITNNTLPTFNGSGGGYSTYSLAVYIVHAGTVFDPANPGSVKPRYLVRADPLDAWTVVTDQTAARTATVKEGELQFVSSMIEEYSLNSYVATGAQLTRSATPSQVIDAGCTSSLFASSIGYPEESECRIELQSWLEREMSNQLSHFDTNAENYDWAPLGDGIYDIYFYDSWTPFSASFPGGLIVDTTKPQVTIAVPANTTADKVSPALTGTVGSPTDTVIVTINGKSYTAKNNGDGTWVLAAGMVDSLASGIYEVVVRATNQAGTVTVTTTTLTIAPRNDLAATGMSVLVIAGIGGGLGVLGGVIYVVRRKISK